mmetsp:Transcript_28857/g.59231  ORF Transcript_28857/g.59231 Transcript_28857/m.59231 type:complete len:441 (+) Transcript_28857:94-1416(+)
MPTHQNDKGHEQPQHQLKRHLDWTAKQGRILTDNGNALSYYSEENGFAFAEEELPHYHLERGNSHTVFRGWAREKFDEVDTFIPASINHLMEYVKVKRLHGSPIVGAWNRPLFTGKWEHSTDSDEVVYNIQTGTLFVDLRIPRSKPIVLWENLGKGLGGSTNWQDSRQILESMTDEDLRLYSRQHVFGGFSVLTKESSTNESHLMKKLPICTRHHCIDWNYVPNRPRPRPNKWYIEEKPEEEGHCNEWKEWSYSCDENGQCYYWENWDRVEGDEKGEGLRLALRKRVPEKEATNNSLDGILVVVGDHFNYILSRQLTGRETSYPQVNNLVEMVDNAIENGDRHTAVSYLTLDGGHGTISSGWKIDTALQPWRHNMNVFDCVGSVDSKSNGLKVKIAADGPSFFEWEVLIGQTVWDIYESSFKDANVLEALMNGNGSSSRL